MEEEVEDIKGIILKEKQNSIKMSRVPKKTHDEFIALAEEEFVGDYGLTLKNLMDCKTDYHQLKNSIDLKITLILQLLESQSIRTFETNKFKQIGGKNE